MGRLGVGKPQTGTLVGTLGVGKPQTGTLVGTLGVSEPLTWHVGVRLLLAYRIVAAGLALAASTAARNG